MYGQPQIQWIGLKVYFSFFFSSYILLSLDFFHFSTAVSKSNSGLLIFSFSSTFSSTLSLCTLTQPILLFGCCTQFTLHKFMFTVIFKPAIKGHPIGLENSDFFRARLTRICGAWLFSSLRVRLGIILGLGILGLWNGFTCAILVKERKQSWLSLISINSFCFFSWVASLIMP